MTSTGALSLARIPEKMLVIGGGVIGLELGSVWSRMGTEVTVVEYMPQIGAGMDADTAYVVVLKSNAYFRSKQFQKILVKQGLKFKLGTKVLSGKQADGKVYVQVEAAKGGNAETVCNISHSNSISSRPMLCWFRLAVARTRTISV